MANSIEEMIKNSICFGVAYDPSVKECKICEVKLKCKSKCGCGVDDMDELPKKPEATDIADKQEVTFDDTKKVTKKPTTVKPEKKKKEVEYAEDMPDLKSMSFDEIKDLAVNRGIDLSDFDKYNNDNIKRMRLTMALKKTYEK